MITPEEIQKKAERKYYSFLSSLISGEQFFPLNILGNKKPSDASWQSLSNEIPRLLEKSKNKTGSGYQVTLEKVRTQKWGEQDRPTAIVFEFEADYLKFIRKETEVKKFRQDSQLLLAAIPQLQSWIIQYPQKILDYAGEWPELIQTVEYFSNNQFPNVYVRELPIQVHTKFVEDHFSILIELLEIVAPGCINQNERRSELKLGLKIFEPLIHVRILDEELAKGYFSGVEEIGITPSAFANLNLTCKKIYIIENKQSFANIQNFLTLPKIKEAIAIFGSGYKSEFLKRISWLLKMEIFYWGDIDEHGFEILSMIRTWLPHTRSFLMDEETYFKFHHFAVPGTPSSGTFPKGLTEVETRLYQHLKSKREKSRLEQEKIPLDWVRKRMREF